MKKSTSSSLIGIIFFLVVLGLITKSISWVWLMVFLAIVLGIYLNTKILSGEKGKHFKFLICDDKSEAMENQWYRLEKWKSPNLLVMKTSYSKNWKIYSTEEPVVGITKENRTVDFILMGDQEDFQIYLEREKDNPVDPNAIKVMGKATLKGESWSRQLGYLAKETAADLKDEEELDARPASVYLPHDGKNLGLKIRILVRSQAYKNKNLKEKLTSRL